MPKILIGRYTYTRLGKSTRMYDSLGKWKQVNVKFTSGASWLLTD